MPPEPNPSEKQNEYISRCVSYLTKKEGKSQKVALGQCYGMWKQAKKRSSMKGDQEEPNWNDEKFIIDIPIGK